MAKNINLHELGKKTLVLIAKVCYKSFKLSDGSIDSRIDMYDLNDQIKKMGFETGSNKDVAFIYELLNLNKEKIEEGTLTDQTIILPGLEEVSVEYYKTVSEVITYYYNFKIDTYSKNRQIIGNYFKYEGDDSVDIYNEDSYDKDYGDSDTIEDGISDIT